MKEIFIAAKAAYLEFVRVWKRRVWIKKHRASIKDPFST